MIELEHLQKVIDQALVVDVEALAVAPGEIAALVGPVGSGLDPLLDLLLGRTQPTAGQVRVAGVDPWTERQALSRRVGVLFRADSLYPNLSARANLTFVCRLHGLPAARADEALTEVGLADRARAPAQKLASGLSRRLALGRALLHHPEVLLLVDPFARCDEASIALIQRLIRQRAGEGVTALILAPDAAHLASLVGVVHTLDKGRIASSVEPGQERRDALPFKIPVKLEDRVALVTPADILYAMAQDGRSYLQTAGERLPTQFTLRELEERLSRSGFFRAHRGYLVNLQHVTEVIPYTRNAYTLILDDGTEIPLSKSAAGELRELLGY